MDKKYKIAKFKLTLLYFGIVFFIVAFFSSVIIKTQFDQIDRIDYYWNHSIVRNPNFNFLPTYPDGDLNSIIEDVKKNVILNVFETDLFILVASIIVSYYLAGQTLEPIEEAFESQKQFIANASHELKTPLTTITTEAEVLLKSERTNERYKEFTKSVLEEAQRLTKLTSQLLSIARSDSHQQKLQIINLNLSEIALNEVKKIEAYASEKQVSIVYEDNPTNVYINFDKARIIQLIDILIENAIKYNKQNGKVNVKVTTEKNKKLLIVQDTGIGISKENTDKIFDRFFQVKSDRHEKGYGLGLSIAKEIIDECSAHINVESEPNKGTKMSVEFKD